MKNTDDGSHRFLPKHFTEADNAIPFFDFVKPQPEQTLILS
jgi:hypothetical protein